MPKGYGPKFLTLTLPHSGDVRRDVAVLTAAWKRFWKSVRRHLRLDRGIHHPLRWFRVLELTPSKGGHAHLHAVLLLPFMHQRYLGHLWAMALPESYRAQLPVESVQQTLAAQQHPWQRKQLAALLVTRRGPHGRQLAQVHVPVIDIRAFGTQGNTATAIAAEAAKYLAKDAEYDSATGQLVWNAITSARLYEASEGVRSVASSRGFWVDRVPLPCRDCGASHQLREVRIEKIEPGSAPLLTCQLARGP
jgi:hypothetical protein